MFCFFFVHSAFFKNYLSSKHSQRAVLQKEDEILIERKTERGGGVRANGRTQGGSTEKRKWSLAGLNMFREQGRCNVHSLK